ncbi:hypothetical protein FIBSPDRAFT_1041495 [Athelia psychrophila]|uniref:Uncharacterized protein n=1 Tax=Athelia psychrophila TaxID=1759441 RepID=A0A166NT32_9AGAM|nr:hypothetical protein FIBSPDRAFT_1041495 [Fibularhizoctonia sp. CBS 109695]
MTPPSNDLRLTIAPSALMHASLASMSPELLTLNTIIHLRSSGSLKVASVSGTSILSIPPEILLVIRGHLLPLVTSHLTALSANALAAHEAMRRAQMCPNCLTYHTHVFGPNTWDWPKNGVCHCAPGRTSASFPRVLAHARTGSSPKPGPATPQEWLETYLSKRAKRLVAARHGPRASMGKGIWDLVTDVLREFECGVVRDEATGDEALSPGACASGALLCIVPAPLDSGSDVNSADVAWRNATTLRRVQRELGLTMADAEKDSHRPRVSHARFHEAPASHTKTVETPAIKAQSPSFPQPSVLLFLLSFVTIIALACP